MTHDAEYHANLRQRMRELHAIVSDHVPADTRSLVGELIEANECGVALEILSETLADGAARLSEHTLDVIANLAETMDLEPAVVDRLKPLVLKADQNGNRAT